MEGLRLTGWGDNQTTLKQQGRRETAPDIGKGASSRQGNILLDVGYMFDAPGPGPITLEQVEGLIPQVMEAHLMLKNNQGNIYDGNTAMTGWQDLPVDIGPEHLKGIQATTRALMKDIDAFVSLGIGGSYLGMEATFKALTHQFFNQLTREQRGGAPEVYFLGQNMDPDWFRDTLDMLAGKRVGIHVISKSGTTTETAIAFRILRHLMEESWGPKADSLILVTTDQHKGALRDLAHAKGYETFVMPEDVGGRFSVLTDGGLVSLAMAGIDLEGLVAGFREMREKALGDVFWDNPCLVHAALRHAAWCNGKKIEVVATNSAALYPVARWMEQLFPESEGHEGHGMWVSPSLYSEKLHANGQMVQEGERNILETFLMLREHDNRVPIPPLKENQDGLGFLTQAGKTMNFVNEMVIRGPAYAHFQGGVPNMTIEIPERSAFYLGQVYYMMERSVAISGYLQGHNPFVQPGVEAYKQAMFALLGKPGFEDVRRVMEKNMTQKRTIRIGETR